MNLMRSFAVLVCFLLMTGSLNAVTAQQVSTQPNALTGIWNGEVLFTSVRADLVQDGTLVNGMAYPFTGVVTLGSGDSAVTYHVNGFINDTGVVGMHPPSDAQFLGALHSPNELRGTITLKSGQEIPLVAKRTQ